jgi:hypothetical protein
VQSVISKLTRAFVLQAFLGARGVGTKTLLRWPRRGNPFGRNAERSLRVFVTNSAVPINRSSEPAYEIYRRIYTKSQSHSKVKAIEVGDWHPSHLINRFVEPTETGRVPCPAAPDRGAWAPVTSTRFAAAAGERGDVRNLSVSSRAALPSNCSRQDPGARWPADGGRRWRRTILRLWPMWRDAENQARSEQLSTPTDRMTQSHRGRLPEWVLATQRLSLVLAARSGSITRLASSPLSRFLRGRHQREGTDRLDES